MADTPSSIPFQLDFDELLSEFAAETARAVKRAIVAEAHVRARDGVITQLEQQLRDLHNDKAAREALDEAFADGEELRAEKGD